MNKCSIEKCKRPYYAKSFCELHYGRWRKHGNPLHQTWIYDCKVEGCKMKHKSLGYCSTHYSRYKKHGNPLIAIKLVQREHPLLVSKGVKLRKGKILKCKVCNKDFYRKPSHIKLGTYCSKKCMAKGYKTNQSLICATCGKEFYIAKSTQKYRPQKNCSRKCAGEWRSKHIRGVKCVFWKGGRSPKHRRIRYSMRMIKWRKKVFERDDYTCQGCGVRSGTGKAVYLEAHHVESFAKFPKLRFTIKNGRTLCLNCHHKTFKRIKNETQ